MLLQLPVFSLSLSLFSTSLLPRYPPPYTSIDLVHRPKPNIFVSPPPHNPMQSPSLLACTTTSLLILLLVVSHSNLVAARGGHSTVSSAESKECIDSCTSTYNSGVSSCQKSDQDPEDKNDCSLEVANNFQHCAATCIPASAA